jgi:MBOAT, membrane-bound O-acyltransferase family
VWSALRLRFTAEPIATAPWGGVLGGREYAMLLVSLGAIAWLLPPVHAAGLVVGAGLVYLVGESSWSPRLRTIATLCVWVGVLAVKYRYWDASRLLLTIEGFFLLRCIDFVRRPRVARGGSLPLDRLGRFALYIFFLPLVAIGPVVGYGDFFNGYRPRMQNRRELVPSMLLRIAWGACKVAAAGPWVRVLRDSVLAAILAGGTGSAWAVVGAHEPRILGATTLALDLFFFIVGYTGAVDVVIGVSRLLGFSVPENFDRPLRSASPVRFWRASNITVYRWLMFHVFFRYWGHRHLTAKVITTFLASGLFHLGQLRVPRVDAALQIGVGVFLFALVIAAIMWLSRSPGPDRAPDPPRSAWRHAVQVAGTFALVAHVQWLVVSGMAGRPWQTTLAVYRALYLGQ